MNRKDRDRGVEMRLTERTRKMIPETGFSQERSEAQGPRAGTGFFGIGQRAPSSSARVWGVL